MTIVDSYMENSEQLETANIDELYAAVNRYCLSLTGSKWDAEDLAQDAWLKAINSLAYKNHENIEALLMRIAKNAWIDQMRRKSKLDQIMRQEQAYLGGEGPRITTDPIVAWIEIEQALSSLMKHLSPLQRGVFFLRDVFGYSSAETANLLGTTEGAVKASLHRARNALDKVRIELEREDQLVPDKERTRAMLQSLAHAYQAGDIVNLVELLQVDGMTPTVVIGIAQNQIRSKKAREHKHHRTSILHMAA
ncbi:RNA polymerase sigma factor [Paenibacillus sp. N1-5-1-14]|uniref:RNA polymerase sigma factor n=1 Tax=Paenibacillus radicibacter TaxID=2972488 RepID=UPI0021598BBD|nr:RNA polymerase sigma factor [Paenibacillus radicibacter]MCR8641154.1 RNA polymerase sigma factor [Paenibacillus radicibacter]